MTTKQKINSKKMRRRIERARKVMFTKSFTKGQRLSWVTVLTNI